jgi:hypothetical protein
MNIASLMLFLFIANITNISISQLFVTNKSLNLLQKRYIKYFVLNENKDMTIVLRLMNSYNNKIISTLGESIIYYTNLSEEEKSLFDFIISLCY